MTTTLRRLVTLAFLVCLLGLMVGRQYCTLHRPGSPQPELGRTVATQLNYNKTVYVTPVENRILFFSNEIIVVPLAVVFIYAGFRARRSSLAKTR
jgi:heme A synthase